MTTPLEVLSESFPEVSPSDYYRALFPAGLMQPRGVYEAGKYNGVVIQIRGDDKVRRVHVTQGLEQIPEMLASGEFSMMAPVLFAGKKASLENARWLTALEFDLDFLRRDSSGEIVGIRDLLYQTSIEGVDPFDRLPRPTYLIVSSERNLHVVYLLERPVAMYRNVVGQVRRFRRALIPKLWDSYITDAHENPQYETSPVQAFRLVGSLSKSGDERVRCFLTGEPVSVEYLNSYVPEESRITQFTYHSELSIDEAKERYPEWYERRVVQGQPARTWQAHRGLYDWWKGKLPEVRVGHRYHYMFCLASFAVKCGISEDELLADVLAARRELDKLSPPDNPLTMSDATKAAQAHQERYRTMTRQAISDLSGIEIQPAKRNGRPQKVHLAIARSTLAILNEAEGRARQGRPSLRGEVVKYRQSHPDATRRQAAEALGCSYATVCKWWKS